MEYHRIGDTDLNVSRLCVGCMNFGDSASPEESRRIIDAALDTEINFFDTANVYNEREGEKLLGETLTGRRDRAVIATKVQAPQFEENVPDHGTWIKEQCEASLRRLRSDYIDLYQLNWPQDDTPPEGVLDALEALMDAGKVRAIGWSTIAPWQAVEFNFRAREEGRRPFVSIQFPYHPLDRRAERELIPMGKRHMGAMLAWGPLAGGFLAGKYSPRDGKTKDWRWGITEDHFKPEAFRILETLREIAARHACSPARIAMAWCAGSEGVTNVIAGPRTAEHLEEYIRGMNLELDAGERAMIDEADRLEQETRSLLDEKLG